jgi:hypothetical protein
MFAFTLEGRKYVSVSLLSVLILYFNRYITIDDLCKGCNSELVLTKTEDHEGGRVFRSGDIIEIETNLELRVDFGQDEYF